MELTDYIPDLMLADFNVAFTPECINLGIIPALKKNRIIKKINSTLLYNDREYLIATVNIGILRKYDLIGVLHFYDNLNDFMEGGDLSEE